MLAEFNDFYALFSWRQPLWLFIAFLPVVLWQLVSWLNTRHQQKFADKHLLPWLLVTKEESRVKLFFSRNTAYFLAWIFFALALAGPRIPDKSVKNKQDVLMNVMMVIDLSQSMQATDIEPSRIRRAVLEAYDFLSIVKNARVGVVVYAARAHLLVPFTSDINALKFYLKDINSLSLPTKGSNPVAAIKFAKQQLHQFDKNNKGAKQVILWLTDMDIEAKKMAALDVELTNQSNIETYLLMLATEEGAAIPTIDGNWLEIQGQAVISAPNRIILTRLKQVANIRISKVRNDNTDWKTLYYQGMRASLSAKKQEEDRWKELFSVVLLPAVVLLIIALHPMTLLPKQIFGRALFIVSFFIIVECGFVTKPLYAVENNYSVAIAQGIKAYNNTNFVKSKRRFIQSVLTARTDQERAIALHNLGNALFQMNDYAHATEIFTDALRYAPKQQATTNNQKLSLAVYLEQEKRKKRRMNRGNLAAPQDKASLYDLPEQLPFMLSTKAVNLLKAKLPSVPEDILMQLSDLNFAELSVIQGSREESIKKQKQQLNMQQARLFYMGQLEQQSNTLWKRLFEIEEGFPGALKKPKEIPGVRPW